MESVILNKKQLKKLKPLDIDKTITNTEGEIFLYKEKNGWKTEDKLIKKMYIDEGVVFDNKLATITSLMNSKNILEDINVILPEKFVIADKNLVGFTLPYIKSENLAIILNDKKILEEKKIAYLKQIGILLEKMRKIRKYKGLTDFYLNDLHEGNFIVTPEDKVCAVDMDSCKINNNKPFPAKYLNLSLEFSYLPNKYPMCDEEKMGFYIPNQNTDYLCYNYLILNYLYGGNVSKFNFEEFYNYLQYLSDIGMSKELIDIFNRIYSEEDNINPYEYLDEINKFKYQANNIVYKKLRKK